MVRGQWTWWISEDGSKTYVGFLNDDERGYDYPFIEVESGRDARILTALLEQIDAKPNTAVVFTDDLAPASRDSQETT